MELRPYQQELINKIRNELRQGRKSVVAVLGCGGGKSIIQASIAKSATDKGNKVLFLVHRRELCQQIASTFAKCRVDLNLCQIEMVQTVARRISKNPLWKPDLIITDECFPAGTLVDGNPIEKIKVGDYVRSYNHTTKSIEYKKVLHVFKNPMPDELIKIDNNLFCTKNHPIYNETKGAYINAENFKRGDTVLYSLPQTDNLGRSYQNTESRISPDERSESVLLKGLFKGILPKNFFGNYVENKQKICFRKNEKEQSIKKSRNESENKRYFEKNRSQTTNSNGKWQRNDGATRKFIQCIERTITSSRVCCEYKRVYRKISRLLQDRYCNTSVYACYRSGRWKPLCISKASRGQKENGTVNAKRLDSIKILEQRDFKRYKFLCGKDYVYNIEVEGNNNYFANGYLVHNCHHALSNSYTKIYDYYNSAVRLGFTATPTRLGKGGLGEVFESMVEGVSTEWLIDNSYLSPYIYYSVKLADTDGLRTRAGEFIASDVNELMEKNFIYGGALENWYKLAPGKKTIVYCASIEASKQTIDRFKTDGISAAHLDGTTPDSERREIIKQFRNGEITVLSNVDLFGEGFDVPDCECVILLRPTMSLTLHIQQSMRSMRYKEGKTAIIIDHVGNVYRHGLPDDKREWTLSAKKKKSENEIKVKQCPVCFAVLPNTLKKCNTCGYEFKVEQERTEAEQKDVELKEITRQDLANLPYNDYTKITTWEEMEEFRKAKKYKFMWSIRKCIELGISYPSKYAYMARRFLG